MAARHSISVKLSALHPRYEFAQRDARLAELAPQLLQLVELAREAGIGLTIDAEEADRLELSLLLIDAVLASDALAGIRAGSALRCRPTRSARPRSSSG